MFSLTADLGFTYVFVPEPVYMNDRKLEKVPGEESREEVLKGRRKEGTTI